jgi:DNA-binding transcriptional ArsR family regulator
VPADDRIHLSAHTLRGIAHPIRVRLLNLLRDEGPSTATRLAERIGESSGTTSYHLRQLAAYGFIVEDEARGGRERWWRSAHRGTEMEAERYREAPAETEAYLRGVAAVYAERVDRWIDQLADLGTGWDRGATLSDARLRLTPGESQALLAELNEVIARYRRDEAELPAPPDAVRVSLQYQILPFAGSERPAGAS